MIDAAILRKVQIDLLADIPNPIIQWFDALWKKLLVADTNVLHRSGGEQIYYYMDHNVEMAVFYKDKGIFHIDDDNYWFILCNKFNLNYSTIKSITKILVEHYLGDTIADPDIDYDLIGLIDQQLFRYLNH